jgi:DNA-binding NarL/FixJ family response regulator
LVPLAAKSTKRITALWALMLLQGLCVAFFVWDAISDASGVVARRETMAGQAFESAVVAALLFGLVFSAVEIRRILRRQRLVEQQLQIASGAFAEILEAHFGEWALTPSECDVALLSIKGLSISDMARLRNTKDGTIKAQCAAIYRKAGVSGRTQLLSLFIEELLGEGIPISKRL